MNPYALIIAILAGLALGAALSLVSDWLNKDDDGTD